MSPNAPATATSLPAARTGTAPAAVRTASLRKTYGSGDNAVHALDGVDVEFAARPVHRGDGPVRVRQVDPDARHRRAGHRDQRHGLGRRHRPDHPEGASSSTRLRRDRIGFVFQQFNLLPTLTAAENIALPMRLAGRTPDQAWLDHVVEVVGLGDRLQHRPSELSGGQQQRVAVRPRARRAARGGLRGRADRQPRLAVRAPRCCRFLRRSVDEMRPDDRHGHPRPGRRQPRRPRRLPRRRPGRRRHGASRRRSECSTT